MFEQHHRANQVIARGYLTESKNIDRFVKGVYPTHVTHASGAFVYDVTGRRYMDFICADGSIIFGHANPYVLGAIQAQLYKGWNYPLSSTLEIEAAERIREIMPFSSRVLFTRSKVVALDTVNQIASSKNAEAIVIQPVVDDYSTKRLNYLDDLTTKCKADKTVLVFDETRSGLRWPNHTFSNDSGRRPDIMILGGPLGGGMPLYVIGLASGITESSKFEVNEEFAADQIALVAMIKTLELLRNQYKLADLWREAKAFQESFNEQFPEKIRLQGFPTRAKFVGDPATIALFWQEALKAGLLFGETMHYTFAHMDHAHSIKGSCADILRRIKHGECKLQGEMPKGLANAI